MRLTIAECYAVMAALNRSTLDLKSGWTRDKDGKELAQDEITKRVNVNTRAWHKVNDACRSLQKLKAQQCNPSTPE